MQRDKTNETPFLDFHQRLWAEPRRPWISYALLAPELEDHATRVADVVLMVAETPGGATEPGAIELSRDIFHLNRFDCNMIGPLNVQASASSGSECILRVGIARWTGPGVCATEEELHIRVQPGVPPVKARAEQVGQRLVVDSRPCVRVAPEVSHQSDHLGQVVVEISRAAVSRPLIVIIGGIHV